jgi:glycosyltransferase involved in cell wall biosynthesis
VLHAHMPKAHVLAGIAGCLIHKPVAATVHGMNVTSHELGITRGVGSHLITNCQESYTQALAMGVPSDRVNLVRNGVDISVFTPGNTGEKLRNSINVPEGTPLVGFVGRLESEKGPDLFLRAAECIHHAHPDVHFIIVGDGLMRNHLKEMCTNMRLEKHVHFLGWHTNTADIYSELDILAHTSRSDGTSLVLLEAMGCACPIVGLAVGGVREIIEHESTGLIAGAGDWEGLGMRVIQLLEQPELKKQMGVAARKRVEQCFNVATNTYGTAGILRRLANDVNGQRYITSTNTSSREISSRTSIERS